MSRKTSRKPCPDIAQAVPRHRASRAPTSRKPCPDIAQAVPRRCSRPAPTLLKTTHLWTHWHSVLSAMQPAHNFVHSSSHRDLWHREPRVRTATESQSQHPRMLRLTEPHSEHPLRATENQYLARWHCARQFPTVEPFANIAEDGDRHRARRARHRARRARRHGRRARHRARRS